MNKAKILFLSGSCRKQSLNKQLAYYASDVAVELEAEVTYIDLSDYPMPLYNGDLESAEGIPDNARALRDIFVQHQGICIASPEYNSSFSPLLKNTLDWISRPDGEVPGLVAYQGKSAYLLSTSPGRLGGLRGLTMLRMVLGNIGVLVMPDQLAIPAGNQAFDAQGTLTDPQQAETLQVQMKRFIAHLSR
ncbi:NADPH-dependent FMN reductase [Photobacterium sp. 1_MG-2023]|uniref:NADPH-dependent FMN reductase n=1 Tax=Photobacterium sp. 1_MG-2023 TaxID=3062646 RepID=UPI0026E27BE9|nr:NAD(P)H-dependent oxidoreductase [Photobacterium sp. 1_MG-2023]MDO6706873.1 NAD(P)H-dependent oxidoreductase [Photobacterium sp. 1_MG-2023]